MEMEINIEKIKVDPAKLLDALEKQIRPELYGRFGQHEADTTLSLAANMHGQSITKIRVRHANGQMVTVDTIDRLLTGIGESWAFDMICGEDIDKAVQVLKDRREEDLQRIERTGWARDHDSCVRCFDTVRRHQARGMCTACYQYEHVYKKSKGR